MNRAPLRQLNPHEVICVAARAGVDPRSVRRFLAGKRQRSTTRARIATALFELHLADLAPVPVVVSRGGDA